MEGSISIVEFKKQCTFKSESNDKIFTKIVKQRNSYNGQKF